MHMKFACSRMIRNEQTKKLNSGQFASTGFKSKPYLRSQNLQVLALNQNHTYHHKVLFGREIKIKGSDRINKKKTEMSITTAHGK